MEKSNTTKIRNHLIELEMLFNLFPLKQASAKQTDFNQIEANIKHTKNNVSLITGKKSLCMIKCTDKLNSPSEELMCYDKCESNADKDLKLAKIDLMLKLIK